MLSRGFCSLHNHIGLFLEERVRSDPNLQLIAALCDGNAGRARELVASGATLTNNQVTLFLRKCSKVALSYNFLAEEYPFEPQQLAALVVDLSRDRSQPLSSIGFGHHEQGEVGFDLD